MRTWPFTAIGLSLIVGGTAEAEPPPTARYRLEVNARPGADRCPTVERLAPAVVARVGHDPFDDDAAARLVVTFEQGPRGYDARIERFAVDGAPAGKKSLAGPSCEALADALALSIAIAVDAPLPPPRPATSAKGSATSAAPLAPAALPPGWGDEPPKIVAPPAAPAPGPRPFAQIGLGALFFGASPRVAPLATLGVGASGHGYTAHVEGFGTLPTSTSSAGSEVTVSVLGGRPVICRAIVLGDRISVCAQGLFGVLQGAAEGAGGKRASTFFAAAGGALQGAFALGARLFVVPSLGASFTFTRTALYANDQAVFTTHPLGVDASVALRLPL